MTISSTVGRSGTANQVTAMMSLPLWLTAWRPWVSRFVCTQWLLPHDRRCGVILGDPLQGDPLGHSSNGTCASIRASPPRVRSGLVTVSVGDPPPARRLATGSRADAGCIRDQEEVLVTGERWKHAIMGKKGELSLDADCRFQRRVIGGHDPGRLAGRSCVRWAVRFGGSFVAARGNCARRCALRRCLPATSGRRPRRRWPQRSPQLVWSALVLTEA